MSREKSSYVLTDFKRKRLVGKFGSAMDCCFRCGKPIESNQAVVRVNRRFYHKECFESLFFEVKG